MSKGRDAVYATFQWLGGAKSALTSRLGDTNKNPGALLDMESAFCRLRQATVRHDTDGTGGLLQFSETDPVGIGLLGCRPGAPYANPLKLTPPTSSTFNPDDFPPPCPEGWGIYTYSSWYGYSAAEPSGSSEPSINYNTRATNDALTYPARWNSTAQTQDRVAFWSSARFISVPHTSLTGTWITFTMPKSEIRGCHTFDANGHVLDLAFMAFYDSTAYLLQSPSQYGTGWSSAVTTPSTTATGTYLEYSLSEADSENYSVSINVPAAVLSQWQSGQYWTFVIYWRSQDSFALGATNVTTPSSPTTVSGVLFGSRRNFFRNTLASQIGWDCDPNATPRIVARNRTHFAFLDGTFGEPPVPNYYMCEDLSPASPIGEQGHLNGWLPPLQPGQAVCILWSSYVSGSTYGIDALADLTVTAGPVITREYWYADWSKCPYFPPMPTDHVEIARMVVSCAPAADYGLPEIVGGYGEIVGGLFGDGYAFSRQTLDYKYAINWLSQTIHTHATVPLGDVAAVARIMPSLYKRLQTLRNVSNSSPTDGAISLAASPLLGLPYQRQSGVSGNKNVTGGASKMARLAMKQPVDPNLLPSEGYVAFEFDRPERDAISSLYGLEPSTVMARLDSHTLSLTGERLDTPNSFEIFLDPSDQCNAISLDPSGNALGQDYTFRMVLVDSDENTLTKDLYVTASRYFVTENERRLMVSRGLSTTGYFSPSTVSNMEQYRLYGYAGVIPDIKMGDSRPILTRVVSPNDPTKETEAQFIQNLQNQGYTQDQINDAIQAFLDGGGQFLVVDLDQRSNLFTSLRQMGVTVTKLASFSQSPWIINTTGYRGTTPSGPVGGDSSTTPQDPALLRADSFSIAPEGLAAGALEQQGVNAPEATDSDLNSALTGSPRGWAGLQLSIQLNTSTGGSISGFQIPLRRYNLVSDASASDNIRVSVALYSDASGTPGQLVAQGGSIKFSDVSTNWSIVNLPVSATLAGDQTYWLVLTKAYETQQSVILFEDGYSSPPTIANFINTADITWGFAPGNPWIGALSNGTLTLAPGFNLTTARGESLFAKGMALKFTAPAFTDHVQVALRFRPTAENATGLPANVTSDKLTFSLYNDVGGSPGSTKLSDVSPVFLNTLNGTWTTYRLPVSSSVPAGTYWLVIGGDFPSGGWVEVACSAANGVLVKHSGEGWEGYSLTVQRTAYISAATILGTFNRDLSNSGGDMGPPNEQRRYTAVGQESPIYQIDSYWGYSSRQLNTPSVLSVYPRAVPTGSQPPYQYVGFSRDIYFVARLWVDGKIVDKGIMRLPGSPAWDIQWYISNAGTYTTIDQTITPSVNTVTQNIDYTGYNDGGVLGNFFNAVAVGNFQPLVAGTYTMRVESDGGVRVYVNGSTTPILDAWQTPVAGFVEFSLGALDPTISYQFSIQYYHVPASQQQLRIFWYSNVHPTPVLLGTNSAFVPTPEPVSLGPELASGIAYLAVGKTSSELNTLFDGAPPGDNIVIRSS